MLNGVCYIEKIPLTFPLSPWERGTGGEVQKCASEQPNFLVPNDGRLPNNKRKLESPLKKLKKGGAEGGGYYHESGVEPHYL